MREEIGMKKTEYLHYVKDGYAWKEVVGNGSVSVDLEGYLQGIIDNLSSFVETWGENLYIDFVDNWEDYRYVIARQREETLVEKGERMNQEKQAKEKTAAANAKKAEATAVREKKELERLRKKYE